MTKQKTGIGMTVKKYREASGMTQLVLAKKAKLSPATIGHLEADDISNPKISTLKKIALTLNVTIDALAEDI